jgi:DNA-binding transcriptional LysR family regulator
MEIYQIRSFLAVAEYRGVTAAARQLFTTPPSVSAHVKAIEEELGIPLFTRTPRGMELTTGGVEIRAKARQLILAERDISDTAARFKTGVSGELVLGLNTDPLFLRIASITRLLRERHEGLRLEFKNSDSDTIVDDLRLGRVDGGFVYGERIGLDLKLEKLAESALVIAIPVSWKIARGHLSWQELARHPWVYTHCHCPFQRCIDREMQARGLAYSGQVKADDEATRRELVRSGAAIAVLDEADGLRLRQEKSARLWRPAPRLRCPLFFASASHTQSQPKIHALQEVVRDVWKADAN